MTNHVRYAFVAYFICLCTSLLEAQNWPGWRGPSGDGRVTDNLVPMRWNGQTGKNVRWKVALPGKGHSSPVIWEDRLLLTTCIEETQERQLICLAPEDGRLLWKQTVLASPLETVHSLNSRASGTPATDGELVFVAFMKTDGRMIPAPNVGSPRDITAGEMVVTAFDLQGEKRWQVTTGPFVSAHGFSSCPVLYHDLVIVNGDHDGESYVIALEKKTGNERWRYRRKHGIRSYCTPIIRRIHEQDQLVFSGSKRIVSLNPQTGSVIWYVEGPTDQFVASMVCHEQTFFATAGYPDYFVTAVRGDGHGDVSETHVAWQSTMARSYVPSPVLAGSLLFVADDRGTANCFDTDTGQRIWRARLGNRFHASLINVSEKVYFISADGVTTVIRPGRDPDVVAKNELGEYVSASPAVSRGRLFIRGEEHLFCIEQQE